MTTVQTPQQAQQVVNYIVRKARDKRAYGILKHWDVNARPGELSELYRFLNTWIAQNGLS